MQVSSGRASERVQTTRLCHLRLLARAAVAAAAAASKRRKVTGKQWSGVGKIDLLRCNWPISVQVVHLHAGNPRIINIGRARARSLAPVRLMMILISFLSKSRKFSRRLMARKFVSNSAGWLISESARAFNAPALRSQPTAPAWPSSAGGHCVQVEPSRAEQSKVVNVAQSALFSWARPVSFCPLAIGLLPLLLRLLQMNGR